MIENSNILRGKNAVITGTARGIGREIMETFARNGANIWACARKKTDEFEKETLNISEKYNVEIIPVYFDLAESEQIKEGLKQILKTDKSIDILVNNAAMVSQNALFQMTTIETMKRVFEVNFFSQMLITQYILKKMIKQKKGSIVNIASVAGIDGKPGQLEYSASKAAIIGATKTLANELAASNIRVNAVAPGITETNMISTMKEELVENLMHKIVMKRKGEPSEIADVVAFLASEMSSYMTGQVLRVDGGML